MTSVWSASSRVASGLVFWSHSTQLLCASPRLINLISDWTITGVMNPKRIKMSDVADDKSATLDFPPKQQQNQEEINEANGKREIIVSSTH